jgi:hypothetical protein
MRLEPRDSGTAFQSNVLIVIVLPASSICVHRPIVATAWDVPGRRLCVSHETWAHPRLASLRVDRQDFPGSRAATATTILYVYKKHISCIGLPASLDFRHLTWAKER